MTENMVEVGSRHVVEIKSINRELTEKALHMRCLSYLSHVKATLLTETIYEIDESKKVLLDVNKRLQKQKDIIEYQNQLLNEKNSELKSFSHSVSHDLRASLRSIEGFSKILLEDYQEKLDATAADYLNRISNAATHMGQLIDALLRLARISHRSLDLQRVDMSALASVIINHLTQSNPEREFEYQIAPHMVVLGDRSLLELALQNLLNNAWKYTSKVPIAKIEIGEKQIDNKRTFYVKDNGIGFDAQYKDKLFKEFSRLHSDQEFKGTGIGLAIVKRIVWRHGGEIWGDSPETGGAIFYFRLHKDIETFVQASDLSLSGSKMDAKQDFVME